MSFNGYYQVLCKNGHKSTINAFEYPVFTEKEYPNYSIWRCRCCGDTAAWWHLVDTTNGSFDEDGTRIDGFIELEVQTPPVVCVCPHCSNYHLSKEATYKIPPEGGHKI